LTLFVGHLGGTLTVILAVDVCPIRAFLRMGHSKLLRAEARLGGLERERTNPQLLAAHERLLSLTHIAFQT
jgi:hypothetical protein